MTKSASMAADVWGKLDARVQAKGGPAEALYILATDDGRVLLDQIADLLVNAELNTRDRFPVAIDYSKPLDVMIAECACDYNNPNITTVNFSITGTGIVEEEVIIVHFNKYISSKNAIAELAKMGLEPAGLVHALAFGKKYPNVQRKYPIVFLGSSCVINGHRHVPYLLRYDSGRGLVLGYFGDGWYRHCRFTAVRTKKS